MSKVAIEKSKIDSLANAISLKSGESVPMTLTEMVQAVDGIATGGGITPTGNINITAAGVTDVTNYATATVGEAIPSIQIADSYYSTINNARKWNVRAQVLIDSNDENPAGYLDDGTYYGSYKVYNAVASGTSITPTESSQTIGAANTMMEGAVTVNAISSTYVGSGITQRTSSDLSASGATVTAPAGYYASAATTTISSGTAGTPTATKGTVNNHSVSVTPSVTNTTGYITGSTKTGTAVTVSASELVSGSETKTANGTYDVTNLAQLVVNVSGGGSSNFVLLGTKAVGTISTSSTTDTDTGQTIVLTGWNDYDLLVCECSVNTKTNGRHIESTRLAWLTASSAISTKNGISFATATHNTKLSSSGTATSRSSTTPYGVYAKAGTISGSNLTITIYQRYNSTQTGTINGTYTMRVYGCKIYDLIGG